MELPNNQKNTEKEKNQKEKTSTALAIPDPIIAYIGNIYYLEVGGEIIKARLNKIFTDHTGTPMVMITKRQPGAIFKKHTVIISAMEFKIRLLTGGLKKIEL